MSNMESSPRKLHRVNRTDCSAGSLAQAQRSDGGGGTAATRRNQFGGGHRLSELDDSFGTDAHQQGHVESMTEGGRDDLGESRAQGAIAFGTPAAIGARVEAMGAGDMADFVHDRTLLRRDEQQHQ
jgi:hypothetical protein